MRCQQVAEWGPGQVWTFSATFKMGGLFKTCGICLEARFPVAVNCTYLGVCCWGEGPCSCLSLHDVSLAEPVALFVNR